MNPGIIKFVKLLNDNGFITCDSGDGETHDFECDRDIPYVVIKSSPDNLVQESHRLLDLLKSLSIDVQQCNVDSLPAIQASYDPINRLAFIDVTNVSDKNLKL